VKLESRAAAEAAVALAFACGHKRLHARQLRCAAHGLDILIEDLRCRGHTAAGLHDIRFFVERFAIEFVELNGLRRLIETVMAGEAGDAGGPAEALLIDRGDHLDHVPRNFLFWIAVGDPVHRVRARARVAVRAVIAECRGHDAHGPEEIAWRQYFERARRDVLVVLGGGLTGGLVLGRSRGWHGASEDHQAECGCRTGANLHYFS